MPRDVVEKFTCPICRKERDKSADCTWNQAVCCEKCLASLRELEKALASPELPISVMMSHKGV